jgi:hypothetical protein
MGGTFRVGDLNINFVLRVCELFVTNLNRRFWRPSSRGVRLMKVISALALSLSATLLAGGVQAANLIQNGSFETASDGSTLPTGNGSQLPSGNTDIADWTVFGGPGFDGVAWLPNSNGYGVNTPFGSYFLDLTGYNDTAPYFGVEQTISTVAGQNYSLTFDLGVDQSSGIYNGPVSVTASAGSTSQVLGPYDPAGVGNQWGAFTLNFTASSASTLISIQGEQGDQYIGLDNVAVNGASGAVPETSSWAMMLIGFAGFAFVGYRKAQKNKTGFAAA